MQAASSADGVAPARRTPRIIGAALLAIALALGLAAPVAAQRSSASRGAPAGQFDYYLLALSWSPGFCAAGGAEKGRSQCDLGRQLGFVVHGLWPQYAGNGYPSECAPAARFPSRLALEGADGVFPDRGLARHEWRIHGTCSGKSPTDFFADVRRARDAVTIPAAFKTSPDTQRWTVLDLKRAFVAANPGLRTDMMDVSCRRGALQEVLICFSKDLRAFTPCGERGPPRCRAAFRVDPMR
ncbi:ribonuclease T2 family protein [Chelatococcus reniformis]|nr:ribonuclease T2 [Chelatococcus reniformis]